MKKIISTLSALSLIFTLSAGNGDVYKVDKTVSKIEWIGKKVTGQHEGTINIKSGDVQLEKNQITGGELVIDMSSIIVTDIEDAGTNAKLKGHLMSDDFFSVKNHPTVTLKINKVEKIEGSKHTIFADLSIKGKTEKVEIPATILMEENKLVVVGNLEVDRTKFDIRYGSGQFFEGLGDKMIDDNFTVKFKVGAKS